MSRVQLALNVPDIDTAVEFYTKLFAIEPHKRKPGYANFVVADPPLKLVLFENADAPGRLNHLGVEVASSDEVVAHQARLTDDDVAIAAESGTCCFADQDKVWVDGPDGEPWEVYTVLGDAEHAAGTLRDVEPGADATCCGPATGPQAVSLGSCC